MVDITQKIGNSLLKLEGEDKIILDISVYPELKHILEIGRLDFHPTYYIPDTIPKLLLKAKENEQYYYIVSRLFTKLTQRDVDLRLLDKIFVEKEYDQIKIELITGETIDKEGYSFCYARFVSKDLLIEFSPEFNLVGDIVGRVIGVAKKTETPILLLNQRLIRFVKGKVPIFDAANMFVDKKQDFLSKFIALKRTRGIRWFIGITVGTMVSPIGFVLTVIDP